MSDTPRRSVRIEDDLWDGLGEIAEGTTLSRSELLRRGAAFVLEAEADQLQEKAEIKQRIEDIRSENIERQKIHSYPNYIEGVFATNIRNGMGPHELESVAHGYREEAAELEKLAQLVDHVDKQPGEIVAEIDDRLATAIEAEGMDNFYSKHDNPFAARLSGVQEGMAERKDVITLMQSIVHSYREVPDMFSDPTKWKGLTAPDLPHMAGDLLPDGVTRDEAAALATELIQQGVSPEDVPNALQGKLRGDEIPVEGETIDTDDEPETADEPTATTGPSPKPASDETQQDLRRFEMAVAAADGGRSAGATEAGWGEDDRDTDTDDDETEAMNPYTDDDEPETREEIDELFNQMAAAAEGNR
mgnify:CR=1 FL=1